MLLAADPQSASLAGLVLFLSQNFVPIWASLLRRFVAVGPHLVPATGDCLALLLTAGLKVVLGRKGAGSAGTNEYGEGDDYQVAHDEVFPKKQ